MSILFLLNKKYFSSNNHELANGNAVQAFAYYLFYGFKKAKSLHIDFTYRSGQWDKQRKTDIILFEYDGILKAKFESENKRIKFTDPERARLAREGYAHAGGPDPCGLPRLKSVAECYACRALGLFARNSLGI